MKKIAATKSSLAKWVKKRKCVQPKDYQYKSVAAHLPGTRPASTDSKDTPMLTINWKYQNFYLNC